MRPMTDGIELWKRDLQRIYRGAIQPSLQHAAEKFRPYLRHLHGQMKDAWRRYLEAIRR